MREIHRRLLPRRLRNVFAAVVVAVAVLPAAGAADTDPRQGLSAGWFDAGSAASALELLAHENKPAGFFNPLIPGSLSFANSDLAFQGDYAFVGNFAGFNIYDVSDPAAPALVTTVVCPGGQGDLSVYGNLLFMSVEETRGRKDCAPGGSTSNQPNADRFRGVRIFDISNVLLPVQLPGVQTCKGSHTHSLVTDPDDSANIYVYNSGTAGVRNAAELAGCNGNSSLTDPTTANFSIDVIKVPLAAPQTAAIVSRPRIFSKCGSSACEAQFATTEVHPIYGGVPRGMLNWMHPGGAQPLAPAGDPRAPGGQSVSQTSQCHDITSYPEIGLAAGACQGDGILLDISDPVNPKRIANATDANFAYWHSATFNNDGTKVVFTDEWGGGTNARCTPTFNAGTNQNPNIRTTPASWGANAIFDIVTAADGSKSLAFRSYYKVPNIQTAQENCVAHNGSLIPVPGRDLMAQAWYQGGLSVWDFTNSSQPQEIAFFDRGPMSATQLQTSGLWSAYWYNGYLFGSEIGRGFDAFGLLSSPNMSTNEIEAASEWQLGRFNAQHQSRIQLAPSFAVSRAYRDQAVRAGTLSGDLLAQVDKFVDRAERYSEGHQQSAAVAQLNALANQLQAPEYATLQSSLRALADATAPFKAKPNKAKPNVKAPSHAGSVDSDEAQEELHAEAEPAE
jgi:hypothetical protein